MALDYDILKNYICMGYSNTLECMILGFRDKDWFNDKLLWQVFL